MVNKRGVLIGPTWLIRTLAQKTSLGFMTNELYSFSSSARSAQIKNGEKSCEKLIEGIEGCPVTPSPPGQLSRPSQTCNQ